MPHCPFLFPERVTVHSGPEHSRLGPHSSPPSQKRRWEMCLMRKRERQVVKFKEDTGKRETDAEGCRSTVRWARGAAAMQPPQHRRPHLLPLWMGGSWEKTSSLLQGQLSSASIKEAERIQQVRRSESGRSEFALQDGWNHCHWLLPHLLPPLLPPLS